MEPLIQAFFYANPDQYPPIINGARLLARAGFELDIFCRADSRQWNVSYPQAVRIHRIGNGSNSWIEYGAFIAKGAKLSSKRCQLFIGHDMHGLIAARIVSSLYKRPLIYHCHDFTEDGRMVSLGTRTVRNMERRFAKTSQLVVVPDADRAAVVRRQLRLPQEPLVVANSPLTRPTTAGEALSRTLLRHGH